MMRHEKTLVNRNLFAATLCTCMDDATVEARLEGIKKVDYERIGEREMVECVFVHDAGDCAKFVELCKKAAALADRHGIDDQGITAFCQHGSYGFDDGGGKQHAGFGGLNGKAFENGREFKHHEFRFRSVYARNAQPVLGGKGRNDAHAVAAEGHNCFEIRLYACTAAGIRSGYGKNIGSLHVFFSFPGQLPGTGKSISGRSLACNAPGSRRIGFHGALRAPATWYRR